MTSEEIQEQFDIILTHPAVKNYMDLITPEWLEFWFNTVGRPEEQENEHEYWEKAEFALLGWLAHEKYLSQDKQ